MLCYTYLLYITFNGQLTIFVVSPRKYFSFIYNGNKLQLDFNYFV